MSSRLGSIVKRIAHLLPFVMILIGVLYILSTQHTVAPESTVGSTNLSGGISTSSTISSQPIRISIPNLGIDLGVKEGAYDASTGQWRIDDSHAYLALHSTTPLIYAHNRPALFAHLRDATPSTAMELIAADGTTTRYRYLQTVIIAKDDPTVLSEADPKTVILLTCNGFFDETRRLVYFTELS